MAMFHFRLKSDKKPSGAKVSAVKHVEYINREGTFAHDELWNQNNKFVGNVITTKETPTAFDGLNALLYKTDEFGSIRNTKQGIETTENASATTISIALMLAEEAMGHKPLIINGSPKFRGLVLKVAFESNLPISFQDKLMQREIERRKKERDNELRRFLRNGDTIITKRPNPHPRICPAHAKTIDEATKKGFSLPALSDLSRLKSSSGTKELNPEETRDIEELVQEQYRLVRYDFSGEQKRLAELTAKKILENMTEAKEEETALSHVEYINRERAFENRGGCLFHAHHLPKWAEDDPKIFFEAADKYEGIGNRRYREIEFALPNELKTVEQYRQIIDAFIAKHLSDHYYAYAIHNKIGVMSEGQHHPHVHIMFSERLIDDVEKTKERPAEFFFLYPARAKKDGSQPSFQERWQRGAPKNRIWTNKNYLLELRANFEEIQNEVLSRNGFSIRVDHRSLKAQKEEAEQNGDTFLARLFSRVPEKYIGLISCLEDDDPKLERLRKFRNLRKQHFDLVMKLDAMTKEAEELEVKDAVQQSSTKAKSLMDSEEYRTQKFVSQYLAAMKSKMLTAVAEVNKWKRLIISHHDAEEQAKLEYMTKAERELWQKYFEILEQKKQLEEFLQTLKKPAENDKEETQAYEELIAGVKAKIFSLFTASLAMKKSVEEIASKLESPEYKKNIQLVIHQILQSNSYALQWLKKTSDNLDKAVEDLRNALFTKTMEEPQTSFKTREMYNFIRCQYLGLKEEYENNYFRQFNLQRQIISPERALTMAKNIFVRGDFKRLRESIRRYKKDKQKLAQKLFAYSKKEKQFKSKDWTVLPRSTFLREQYYLTKERMWLEVEKARLDQIKLSLQNKQNELESLCQSHESKRKIEEIAAGILRKNLRFVRQLEELETQNKKLFQRMTHAEEQMKALENRIALDKVNTRYRVTISDTLSNSRAASLIADAILFKPQAIQLVARSNGDNLEMEKDWELMSELDKDEFLCKKIIREL